MVIENTSYMLNLFKDNSLPYSIVRIGISKSLDSYRVSPEDKLRLRMIRKNLFSLQKKDDPSDPPSEE